MGGITIRMMVPGAATGRWSTVVPTLIICFFWAEPARPQVGPLEVDGFIEYQYRLNAAEDRPSFDSHLGTLRTNLSTYVWRPWIMQVNASLGITKTQSEVTDPQQAALAQHGGTLLTGRLRLDLFRQSRFPFAAYVESQDSRVDGDLPGTDTLTTTYGFVQQYSAVDGGRYLLEYRHIDADSIYEAALLNSRSDRTDMWQAQAQRSFGRNRFEYKAVFNDIARLDIDQTFGRDSHTLQHRFSTGSGLFMEDTLFLSDENTTIGDSAIQRRFLQLNSISTWRPPTERPLLVVVRGLLQGAESGTGASENTSKNLALSGSATYQFSERFLMAANLGAASSDSGRDDDQTTMFQRLRADYRSVEHTLWSGRYRWVGSAEVGNETGMDNVQTDNSVQDVVLRFNHRLSRQFLLNADRRFDISVTQDLATATDTFGVERNTLTHSLFGTLSRQNGRRTSYIRLTATDRRTRGDQEGFAQLVNFQASLNSQVARDESWNGSMTVQFGRIVNLDIGPDATDDQTVSYSADLRYRKANLFDINDLNFTSELRVRSSDFLSEDPFDQATADLRRDRTDADWRNRLNFQVGQLQLRLEANLREIDSHWTGTVFLGVRRYYGNR